MRSNSQLGIREEYNIRLGIRQENQKARGKRGLISEKDNIRLGKSRDLWIRSVWLVYSKMDYYFNQINEMPFG